MKRVIEGAVAGFAATIPMTAVMKSLHAALPEKEQYPLPPRTITMNVAEKAGVKGKMGEDERFGATMVAHFGFGTVSGALFGVLRESIPLKPPVRGAVYGLAVWTGSYLGLLPAMNLISPATKHPVRRNLLMIAAHLVYGVALDAVIEASSKNKS
jgi:uncharacterized membrane protein YagU involved in acid resistance